MVPMTRAHTAYSFRNCPLAPAIASILGIFSQRRESARASVWRLSEAKAHTRE